MFYGNLFALGSQVTLLSDILRHLSFFFDGIIYSLIPSVFSLIYELYDLSSIFNDTTATKTLINNFTTTIYSFLAIFMFFRVAFSLLGMLVDPSKIDDKDAGVSKIVKNILITLVLIVVVPIIFDYAKVFQKKVIEEHIIERALYGYNASDEIENLGEVLALNTWKTFVNITDESKASTAVKTAYDGIFNASTTELGGGVWPVSKLYFVLNETVGIKVLGQVPILGSIANGLLQKNFEAGTYYQISYVYILSTIVGFYVLISVIKLMIDVAYRSIKFFALELLSPIAIVSYIDPNSAKKGIFAKWLKQVVSTYLSLFVRIFVFALASVILASFNLNSISIGTMKKLIYLLAVVAFIKVAPKFIDDIFGTTISKDSDTKFAFDLLKQGLGFATGAAVGGISNAVVAKRTGQPVFKNAVKGAWSSGNKMSAAAKKTGYDYWSGMIGAGVGAVNDSYKNLGYKVDKDRDRRIAGLESKVDTVDAAKSARAEELGKNNDAKIKEMINNTKNVNGRSYGRPVQNDAQLANAAKKTQGGLVRDEILHKDLPYGDEYMKLRYEAADKSFQAQVVQRTLDNAKDNFSAQQSMYSSITDDDERKKYIIDLAAQNVKKMGSRFLEDPTKTTEDLSYEFAAMLAKQAGEDYKTKGRDYAIQVVAKATGVNADTVKAYNESKLVKEYNKVFADALKTSNNATFTRFTNAQTDADKINVMVDFATKSTTAKISSYNTIQLNEEFTATNADSAVAEFGNSLNDMISDAGKAKGDADAADAALKEFLKGPKGQAHQRVDDEYKIAEGNTKARKSAEERAKEAAKAQNNNGGNTN